MDSYDRRDRIVNALVDESVTKAISGGLVLTNELAFRAKKRAQVEAQAANHPDWLQQQSERLYGGPRPSHLPTCPHCEIVFPPFDEEVVRANDGLLYCRQSCADRVPFGRTLEPTDLDW